MTMQPFVERERVDARDKVLGATRYAADFRFENSLFAMTAPARIAKGRVAEIDTSAAMRVPGVVRVLTAADFPPPSEGGGSEGGALPPPATLRQQIAWRGEPIALVLGETLEAVIEGAEAIGATYADEPFAPLVTSEGAVREPVEDVNAGDAAAAMARAVTRMDADYEFPAQHHNPIELLATTAVWADGRFTIYESTQGAQLVKAMVARALRLDPAIIDVNSSYIGGGFGQKGEVARQTALVARAAMLTGRPVRMVVPRGQVFHNAKFRPLSRHRLSIGADAQGRMIAIQYDADHQQSRQGQWPPQYHEATVQTYGVADYLGTAANVRIDTQAPGQMRAPTPHPASFGFECAVDELADKLGRDPVAFRLAHDATIDPLNGKPLSSRFLDECLREGARRFGWAERNPTPGAMVLPDGTQVGWGVGCGAYPARTTPNMATLRIAANGTTRFALAGHEMGQGIRTVVANVLLDQLDIDPDKLEIVVGDTSAAPQHLTAGSWGTASTVPVADKAARQMQAAIAELLAGRQVPGNLHRQLAAVRRPFVEIEVSHVAPDQQPQALERLRAVGVAIGGPEYPQFSTFSYIAHFAEVHVEPRTRRVRVPRFVSVADCGRVVSPRTAESQMRGAIVWAIGSALQEGTEVDPRYGGWLNNDLADYVVPVNADIADTADIDVSFIDRPDPLLNTVGAKGLGEVALVGATASIVNAIYHATGKRHRKIPVRVDDLL